MPFPADIETLIIEYSDWLVKYADHKDNMFLYASPSIKDKVTAFKLLRAEDKTIERRLEIINLFVYSRINENLMTRPAFLLTPRQLNANCSIEDFSSIKDYNLSQENSQDAITSDDIRELHLLSDANKIFFTKWKMRCNTEAKWQEVNTAITDSITNNDISSDVTSWTCAIKLPDESNAINADDEHISHVPAVVIGFAVGALASAGAATLLAVMSSKQQNDTNEAQSIIMYNATGIGILTGFLTYVGCYIKQNYGDEVNEKICSPMAQVVSPCWNKIKNLTHTTGAGGNAPLLNNNDRDIEMQALEAPPIPEPNFPKL